MVGKVLDIDVYAGLVDRDTIAKRVSDLWREWTLYRNPLVTQWQEVQSYVFATDTTTTSNSKLPWRNSTTIPKLAQIRENLHANYMAAVFPNDEYLKWEGDDFEAETREKVLAITGYMRKKLDAGKFKRVVSRCIYDLIDTGNMFVTAEYANEKTVLYKDTQFEEEVKGFIGPRALRVNPLDIVFNPLAPTFESSPKIIRSIKTLGELRKEIRENPERGYIEEYFNNHVKKRIGLSLKVDAVDTHKAKELLDAGLGSIYSYFQTNYCEILDVYGDIYLPETDELLVNQHITVIDGTTILKMAEHPSWFGRAPIYNAVWKPRPNSLYGQGPLEQLVGMQYKMDHYENMKADVLDQVLYPTLVVTGDVEPFDITRPPGTVIYTGDEGKVDYLRPDSSVLAADNQNVLYQNTMEEMAGAPKQSMGIRTPGEKTKFEVQVLDNAANRIFLHKASEEIEESCLEPLINHMYEVALRNMTESEIVRSEHPSYDISVFRTITKEDITAKGKLRPIGARHIAKNANKLQELVSLSSTPLGQLILPHISGVNLAELVKDLLSLNKYNIIKKNIQVPEQAELEYDKQIAMQTLQVQAQTEEPFIPQ